MGVALRRANSAKAQIFFKQVQDFARLHRIDVSLGAGLRHRPRNRSPAPAPHPTLGDRVDAGTLGQGPGAECGHRFADVHGRANQPDSGVPLIVRRLSPRPRVICGTIAPQRWRYKRATGSGRMRLSVCSVTAPWARSIARAIRGCGGTSRSRCFPQPSPTMPTVSRVSSAKRA